MLNVTNNNQTVATYKAHQNLHFATILDAGHLVPFDQPESMNLILDNFIDSVLEQSSKPVKANAWSSRSSWISIWYAYSLIINEKWYLTVNLFYIYIENINKKLYTNKIESIIN